MALTLREALQVINNTTVTVATDNALVVSYIDKQGGLIPQPCAQKFRNFLKPLTWCLQRRITLSVRHIPGRFNILADRLSRMLKPILTEWSLNQRIANQVVLMTGYPNIDLFASRLNNRLSKYLSPIPDNRVLAIDALSLNWDRIHVYTFPPLHIIPAVLNKIRQFRMNSSFPDRWSFSYLNITKICISHNRWTEV